MATDGLSAGSDDHLVLKSGSGSERIRLEAAKAAAWIGGNGDDGNVVVFTAAGDNKTSTQASIHLKGNTGDVVVGGATTNGDVAVRAADGSERIRLEAGGANAWLGGNGASGDVVVFTAGGDNKTATQASILLSGNDASIAAGGNTTYGDLVLRAADGSDRVRVDAAGGNIWLGGNGAGGDVVVFPNGGDNKTLEQATIQLDGDGANVFAGGNGVDGDLVLRGADGSDRVRVDAGDASVSLGGAGADGDLVLRAIGGSDRVRLHAADANVWLGGNGADGDLVIFAKDGDNQTTAEAAIHLNGADGDIILLNADCAEDFEFEDTDGIVPGSVVEIGDAAGLRLARGSYSRRVAGIVAGAGNLRPGIVLGRTGGAGRLPVALVGRAYCQVDARVAPIEVGDLLTTSATPGHAMKAADPARAFGAVLGKSLGALRSGTGLVPVLIALQ